MHCSTLRGEKGWRGALNPAIRQSLLQSSSATTQKTNSARCRRHNGQMITHLNPGDEAAHNAQQDARLPLPRRPRAHVSAGRGGRQPVACRRCKADRSALQLSWPKRDAHVVAGRRRQLEREGMAAGQVQARGGGGDDVEWRVDLCALGE
jgi:hypothetical protein